MLKLGLSSKYKNRSSEKGQWLKKIFDLPFSPSNEMVIFFALNLWRLNQIMTFLSNFVTIWYQIMSKSHLGFHHIYGAKLRTNKLVRQTFASHFIRILIKVFILRTQIFMCL
jgi:hypothetical protein